MFSLCTFKTRPASSYYTQTVVGVTLFRFFIVDTPHKALAICICPITNTILYCTNDVFLYSFPQYNEMNSMNIWWFFSKKNRYTLTVNSCTSFFFSYLISVCRNCHRSCCKWCFLTNCVLVLLLFDSVYSLDLLQSDLCDWNTLEASGYNWIKIFWQLFVSRCHRVFSLLRWVQGTLCSITFYVKIYTWKNKSSSFYDYDKLDKYIY